MKYCIAFVTYLIAYLMLPCCIKEDHRNYNSTAQKQLPRGVPRKRCSEICSKSTGEYHAEVALQLY